MKMTRLCVLAAILTAPFVHAESTSPTQAISPQQHPIILAKNHNNKMKEALEECKKEKGPTANKTELRECAKNKLKAK